MCREQAGGGRSTGVQWGGAGRKDGSHLVPGPLLPEVHLILQIRRGHAGGQLVGGVDAQDLSCVGDCQDGRGWLHWQKQNRTCQEPLGGTGSPCPCLQAQSAAQSAHQDRGRQPQCPSDTYCVPAAFRPFHLSPAGTPGGDLTPPILKKGKRRLRGEPTRPNSRLTCLSSCCPFHPGAPHLSLLCQHSARGRGFSMAAVMHWHGLGQHKFTISEFCTSESRGH